MSQGEDDWVILGLLDMSAFLEWRRFFCVYCPMSLNSDKFGVVVNSWCCAFVTC